MLLIVSSKLFDTIKFKTNIYTSIKKIFCELFPMVNENNTEGFTFETNQSVIMNIKGVKSEPKTIHG